MGGHSGVVLDLIQCHPLLVLNRTAFVDIMCMDIHPCIEKKEDRPVITWASLEKISKLGLTSNIIVIPAIGDCEQRFDTYSNAIKMGYCKISVVSSDAKISQKTNIGHGTVVVRGAIINNNTKIGDCCIINTKASVDHDCVVGDGSHIAVGATLCGKVHIGKETLVGAGSVILPNISVGSNVKVGAGAVVTKDLPDNCVAVGNPARIIRSV